MNAQLPDSDPSIIYYDSDYPSREGNPFPENFDATVAAQGLSDDVQRYLQFAASAGGPMLELCCGTGRVALP